MSGRSMRAAKNPAAAKPRMLEAVALTAISEFAAPSAASSATSGSTLSCAGSKNCWTVLERATKT